jgi:hypothetical protein
MTIFLQDLNSSMDRHLTNKILLFIEFESLFCFVESELLADVGVDLLLVHEFEHRFIYRSARRTKNAPNYNPFSTVLSIVTQEKEQHTGLRPEYNRRPHIGRIALAQEASRHRPSAHLRRRQGLDNRPRAPYVQGNIDAFATGELEDLLLPVRMRAIVDRMRGTELLGDV